MISTPDNRIVMFPHPQPRVIDISSDLVFIPEREPLPDLTCHEATNDGSPYEDAPPDEFVEVDVRITGRLRINKTVACEFDNRVPTDPELCRFVRQELYPDTSSIGLVIDEVLVWNVAVDLLEPTP